MIVRNITRKAGLLSLLMLVLISSAAAQLPDVMSLQSQLVYYGRWSDADIPVLQRFDLVVLQHTHYDGMSETAAIQRIRESGTLVLLYISLGEDVTTFNGQEPRVGDGRGPSFFDPITERIIYEHAGVAGFYLDNWNTKGFLSGDNANRYPDGEPDRHGDWGACYVNAGDPAWQAIIIEEASQLARIGIDGFFLDTPETPDPWQGYGWTAEGMHDLIALIDETFPQHLLLLNRGTFFFDPNNPYQHRWSPINHIDIALFESYFLDSNYPIDSSTGIDYHISPFYPLNKLYTSPKVNVAVGYKDHQIPVIQIDYARDPNTFPVREPAVYQQLLDESVLRQGRLGLLIDRELNEISTVYLDHPPSEDREPPTWENSSLGKKYLYAATVTPYDVVGVDHQPDELFPDGDQTQIPAMFAPRVGVQKAIPRDGAVTLLWDVAVDQTRPVRYNVYYTAGQPFDLDTAVVLTDVDYIPSSDYQDRSFLSTDDACPYEFTVEGLQNGVVHYFCVRAEDSSRLSGSPESGRIGPGGGIEDENLRIVPAVPCSPARIAAPSLVDPIRLECVPIRIDGSLDDWSGVPEIEDTAGIRSMRLYDTPDDLYIAIQTPGTFDIWDLVIYLDTDDTSYRGHPLYGGSDLMFKQGSLFTFTWDWHNITGSGEVYSFSGDTFELRIPKSLIGTTNYHDIRVVIERLSTGTRFPTGGFPGVVYRQRCVLQDVAGPVFPQKSVTTEDGEPVLAHPLVRIEDLGVGESLRVSWHAAQDINGPVLYDVLCGETKEPYRGSDQEPLISTQDTSVVITGLAEGVSRSFIILARDSAGNSTELAPVQGTPTFFRIPPTWLDSPAPGIQHVHEGDGSVRVYFNRATDRFGYPVTYLLSTETREGGAAGYSEIVRKIRPMKADTPEYDYYYDVDGLENGREYVLTLIAETLGGVRDVDAQEVFATPRNPDRIRVETIDGRFGDWELDPTVIYIGKDILGDHPERLGYFDIDEVWQSIKDETLFLRFTVKDPIEKPDWQMSLFFDLDGNIDTGFKGVMGTDLMVLGSGQAFRLKTSTVWEPEPVGYVAIASGSDEPNSVELAIPFSLAGNVEQQALLMMRFGNWIDNISYDEFGPISLRQGSGTRSLDDTEDESLPILTIILLACLLIIPMIVIFVKTNTYM